MFTISDGGVIIGRFVDDSKVLFETDDDTL